MFGLFENGHFTQVLLYVLMCLPGVHRTHAPLSSLTRSSGQTGHSDKRNQNVYTKIVSEYDQEIPQSQTAVNPVAPRGRAAQPQRDTRKTK